MLITKKISMYALDWSCVVEVIIIGVRRIHPICIDFTRKPCSIRIRSQK